MFRIISNKNWRNKIQFVREHTYAQTHSAHTENFVIKFIFIIMKMNALHMAPV